MGETLESLKKRALALAEKPLAENPGVDKAIKGESRKSIDEVKQSTVGIHSRSLGPVSIVCGGITRALWHRLVPTARASIRQLEDSISL